MLAVYVDAYEPYGGLRAVDLLGGIPIKIMSVAFVCLGAFFVAMPLFGKFLQGVYTLLRSLPPDVRELILVAIVSVFFRLPIFCLIVSLWGILVVVRRIAYWDEKLAEALLVELRVSNSPTVDWAPDALEDGAVTARAGACKYCFERSFFWKFRARLRHSHVYVEPVILANLTDYIASGTLPDGFEPLRTSKPCISLRLDTPPPEAPSS